MIVRSTILVPSYELHLSVVLHQITLTPHAKQAVPQQERCWHHRGDLPHPILNGDVCLVNPRKTLAQVSFRRPPEKAPTIITSRPLSNLTRQVFPLGICSRKVRWQVVSSAVEVCDDAEVAGSLSCSARRICHGFGQSCIIQNVSEGESQYFTNLQISDMIWYKAIWRGFPR